MLNSIMKKCSCKTDTGLLILRIGVGAIFLFTGWMKVSDLKTNLEIFKSMNIGAFWAYTVAFVEFIGGISILLGIYSRISAAILTVVMIVAAYMVRSNSMIIMTPALLVFANMAIAFAGSGKYSLLRKKGATNQMPNE